MENFKNNLQVQNLVLAVMAIVQLFSLPLLSISINNFFTAQTLNEYQHSKKLFILLFYFFEINK